MILVAMLRPPLLMQRSNGALRRLKRSLCPEMTYDSARGSEVMATGIRNRSGEFSVPITIEQISEAEKVALDVFKRHSRSMTFGRALAEVYMAGIAATAIEIVRRQDEGTRT